MEPVIKTVVHEFVIGDYLGVEAQTIYEAWERTDIGQWICKHSPCITYKSYMDENLGFLRITFVAYLTPSDYTFFTLKFST